MAVYEMEGSVKLVLDQQTFPSGFTKREFVVTTDDKYPQDVKFECVKERTELLDGVNAGDRVKVSFDIRGNEFKERYYVNLSAWKLEKISGDAAPKAAEGEDAFPGGEMETDEVDPEDNIPF